MSVFRKHDDGPVSTALEAQGLTWLAEAMNDVQAYAHCNTIHNSKDM